MDLLMIVLSLLICHSKCMEVEHLRDETELETITNSTEPGKDMYVIHAMVYQIGIVTNRTNNETRSKEGDQTSVTFFNTNGSNIDLSQLPPLLETNVTAQRLIGVAPAPSTDMPLDKSPFWNILEDKTSPPTITRENREISYDKNDSSTESNPVSDFEGYYPSLFKRSMNFDSNKNSTRLKLEKGVSTIPQETGVQSIVIPPLLALNSNFSEIPVPIPNTSVVQYATVNTLFNKP